MLRAKLDMTFQKLLLNSLIFIEIAFFTGECLPVRTEPLINCSLENDMLPSYIIPKHYNIKLMPQIEEYGNKSNLLERMKEERANYNFFFSGESDIDIEILLPTQDIYLHLLKSQIDLWSIELFDWNDMSYDLKWYHYYYEPEIIVLRFNELSPGNYKLKLKFTSFSIIDNINGLFRTSYEDNNKNVWVFATRFQAIGARRMFPCWDEPRFMATFNISIKHNSRYMVLSNMPVHKTEPNGPNTRWTHFKTTFPMPTYLVTITLNEFVRIFPDRISLLSKPQVKEHMEFTNTIIRKVTTFLEYEWKNMKKIPKVDHVAIPQFLSDGMSSVGLSLYRESSIACSYFDSISHKMEVARLIGYKVAHQLFGGIVSPSWWYDLWLNEGLSLLIGMETVAKSVTHIRTMDLFTVQDQYESLQLNSYFAITQDQFNHSSEINSLLYFPRHIKAFCLLRMLQHLLSNEIFRKGVQIYLNKHEFKSASADDLWNAMQIALEEVDLIQFKPDIKKLMDSWIQQKHYPTIKATHKYNNGLVSVSLNNFNESIKSWIPMTFTTMSKIAFDDTSITKTFWLNAVPRRRTTTKLQSYPSRFDSNPKLDNWIIVNLQQSGYYRVNYDHKNWLSLAAYLNTRNYVNIHVLNRAKLIDDAFYFMTEGKLNASIFWELTSYLSQETVFTAWYPMFKAFEHMSIILPFSDQRVEKIMAKMHHMLDGVLKITKYDEINQEDEDLTKRLMLEAAKWACLIRHPGCMEETKNRFSNFLKNPTKHKPLPWWREWTFCNGLIKTNTVWNILSNKRISNTLLGCSNNPDIIIKHLKLIESEDENERVIVTCLHSVIARNLRHSKVLEYMLLHFDDIKPRKFSTVALIIDIINQVYSNEQLVKIRKFVRKYVKHQYMGHINSYHFLIFKIHQKIKLRESQINDQMNIISKFRIDK